MPSRKKDRGKQRKAAKQSRDGLAGRASPMGAHIRCNVESGIRQLKAEGCRIILCDDGSSTTRISHPCFEHIGGKGNPSNFLNSVRNFDRGLLSDDQRKELAENYVHNFGQEMREGDFHGTHIIASHMVDPHLRQQLGDELVKADIHTSMLHFLNQSHGSVSDVLGRVVDAGDSITLPLSWVAILGILVSCDGLSVESTEDTRLAVAKNIGPFVMRMMDQKRELFQSNVIWHKCISPFFDLVRGLLMSRGGFLAMISYEGFLPFVAQASCWSQSREDIASESEILRQVYPDPNSSPEPLSATSHEAQKFLSLAIAHYGVAQEDTLRGALDQIACAPLLSNDPNCNYSTMVGLVRMMNAGNGVPEDLLHSIIEPLLLKHGYVDKWVIAELIEYGRGNQSIDAVETVLCTMLTLLGLDQDYDHIQLTDSRYAAAVRNGFVEFCIDALIAHGDTKITKGVIYLAHTLCASMAMHSKTSRALRERKAGIMTALDALRKKSVSQFDEICTIINDAVEDSSCAVCCNCLKEVDRKDLLYCKRCGVECYCSLGCQKESFGLGHDEICKKEAHHSCELKGKGLSETELKRIAVLGNNLMMNGCRLVRTMAAELLDEERNDAEVTIDFGEYPPDIKVSRDDTGECSGSGNLKFIFIVPVDYGFAEKVDVDEVVLEKIISRRSLVQHLLEGLVDHLPDAPVPTCNN